MPKRLVLLEKIEFLVLKDRGMAEMEIAMPSRDLLVLGSAVVLGRLVWGRLMTIANEK